MQGTQFLNDLAKGGKPLPPVILFCPGTAPFKKEDWEPQLAEQATKIIVDAQVDPSMHDMALTTYYADETKPGDVTIEAQTMPFLSPNRVVIVRNAEKFAGMAADKKSPLFPLINYLEDPADFTTLIFIASQVDKRMKFYKACAAAGLVVECPQLDDKSLASWTEAQVKELGKTIQHAAINELLHRAGNRLSDINNSLQLVVNYVGDNDTIKMQDVVAATADVAEESVWALTDAIAKSDARNAINALHQLLSFGKAPDEVMGLINWLLESAYAALPHTAPTIKSPYVLKKVEPLAKHFGAEKIKRAFSLCTDTHFMIRSTGVDQQLALELLVVKLTFPMKKSRQ